MTTMREHFRKVHERNAEAHLNFAKCHQKLVTAFGKVEGMEGDVADAHKGLAEQHLDLSEFHVECCKALDATAKAAGMGDGRELDQLEPSPISAVYKDSVRPVPRSGAPEIRSNPPVAQGFEKFFTVEDD